MTKFGNLNAAMAEINCIEELSIIVDRNSGKSDLELLLVREPHSIDSFRVRFRDVADVKCTLALGGGWTQVQMLGIREIREGFERPYVVKEIEYDTLSFRCASAELVEGRASRSNCL